MFPTVCALPRPEDIRLPLKQPGVRSDRSTLSKTGKSHINMHIDITHISLIFASNAILQACRFCDFTLVGYRYAPH